MVGGTRSVRVYSKWLGSAVLIALLLGSSYAHAADNHPLRPTDTSSPRATLQDFVETTDDVYRRLREVLEEYGTSDRLYLSHEEQQKQISALREAPKIGRFLDVSGIAPVLKDTVTVERILQLKEILDRIDIPAFADIPDREAMARQPSKRWRLPNTEIDIVLIENGPRAGEYLVSAATIDRLPEFYDRVKDLPYKPGSAQQLAEVYRSISHGASATIYDAFLSSPAGLSYVIPPRWMLNLPDWARARVAGVAIWQWLGLGLGFLVGGLIILGGHRLVRRRADDGHDAAVAGWRVLPVPLAIIFVAGLLVPWLDTILRIGGNTRVAITYAATGAVVLGAAWLAILASVVIGEAIVASEHLRTRSLDSQLIRLGTRLVGLVAATVILVQGGDELGFPAYSILAGLGVGGLAVALAAQSTIANLIGSLLITLEKPFRVGHVVRIGTSEGTVEDVGFRSTRIRTPDNTLVTIPSSAVVNTTVENLSLRTKRRQRFFLQLTYDTPREKVEELVVHIRQLIIDHPLAEESTCQVRFNNLGESSLDVLVMGFLVDEGMADYPSVASLTRGQPLGQAMLPCHFYRFRREAGCHGRRMAVLESVRGNPERPREAVRIIAPTAMRHRLFHETCSGLHKACQQMGLPRIQPANHTGMLAVDRELLIRNDVGDCRSLGENVYGLPEFSGDKQRVAQCPKGYGEPGRILVWVCHVDKISCQRDGFRNRQPHKARIPREPLRGKAAFGPGELVRKFLRPEGTFLDPLRSEAVGGDQRYCEGERKFELPLVTPLAGWQRSQQIERTFDMIGRLQMGRMRRGALAGLEPLRNGPLCFGGTGQMVGQQFGPPMDEFGEVLVEYGGDAPVQFLASAAQEGAICRILHQCVLEQIRCVRHDTAAEQQPRAAEPVKRDAQLGFRPPRDRPDKIVRKFTAKHRADLGYLLGGRPKPIEAGHQCRV